MMKPFPRLALAAALAAFLSLPSLSAFAQGDEASHRAAADELLKAMHTEQLLGTMMTRMYGTIDKLTESMGKQSGLTEEQIAAGKKAQEEARESIRTQLSWDVLKSDAIQAYEDAFTESELKELTAFYQTPLGQKLIEKQPEISEKMTKLTQQRVMAVMPAVMQKIRDSSRKTSKPDGTPASTVTPVLTATPPPANSTTPPVVPTPPVPQASPTPTPST